MSERTLRLILVSIMFVTLFLPNTGEPNWFFIFWSSINILAAVTRLFSIGNVILWLVATLFLLTVPILILLNACLAAFPSRGLKIFYRISLLVLFPLMWWETCLIDPAVRGAGFWAILVIGTAATLMEIVFIISERLRKRQSTGPAVE